MHEARVLSLRELAVLLMFTRDLPAKATAEEMKLWLVNYVSHCSSAFGLWHIELPVGTPFSRGTRVDHDLDVPPPEWMVSSQGVNMHVAERTKEQEWTRQI